MAIAQRLPHPGSPTQELLAAALLAAPLLLYYFSLNLLVSAAASCIFVILAWWRLDMALLTVIITAPFYRFPKTLTIPGITQTFDISLAEYALGVCLIAWLLRLIIPTPLQRELSGVETKDTWLKWALPALLVGVAALSLPFTEHLRFALREYRVVVIEPALYYFLLVSTLRSPSDVARSLFAFLALGAAVAAYSLYHYVFVGVVEAADGVRRVLAVYHSPNALALFLGRLIPSALTLSAAAIIMQRSWRRAMLPFVTVILLLAAFYITFSRGAWLGIIAAFVFILIFLLGRRAVFAVAGLVILSLLAIPLLPWERLLAATPLVQRLYVWQAAVAMLGDHPLTGIGMDNFLYYYPQYILPQAALEPDISHPHNLILDFWLRLGILGLPTLVWLQYQFWRAAGVVWRSAGAHEEKVLALAIMASMVDFLVHGLIDNSYFLIDLAYIFWFTCALMTVLYFHNQASQPTSSVDGAPRP